MADKIISRVEARAQGLTRYFTGKPCKRGHIAERGVASFACLVCSSIAQKEYRETNHDEYLKKENEWREKNREKLRDQENVRNATPGEARDRRLALRRLWRQKNHEKILAEEAKDRAANPEKHREKARKSYNKNPERGRARAKKWREENLDKRQQYLESTGRQKNKEWRDTNKEYLKEYFAQWTEDNREKKYSYIHKRRALKKQSSGTHTAEEAAVILVAQNYQCAYCDADLRIVKRHLDHIMPLSKGGSNDKSNIQWLCRLHNLQKGDKDPVEYERSIGFVR